MSRIKTVLMVGAGVMGTGIAQHFASRGVKVILMDQTPELLERAKVSVAAGVEVMESEGLYTPEQVQAVEANISYATVQEMDALGPAADLAIESASERQDVKQSIFAGLDRACRPDCIFCSNTSSTNVFSFITVSHPERLMIAHWFNPAYLMKLVEVVKGPETSDEAALAVVELLREVEKMPCVLNQYVPGFIINRLANALCREVGYMIMNGWTTGKDIDDAIKAINGVRYAFEGPLGLNDVVGWDLILTGCRDVYASLCNDADTSQLAEKLVADGKLGVKSGSGIYDYGDTDPAQYMKERAAKIIKMYKAAEEL